MKSDLSNLKLSVFFDSLELENENKLMKLASIGNFNDVISEDDVKKNAKMVFEMLQLPKYEDIKAKLRNSSGVVNFVTNNEYEPLVELLIKSVFPPSANDIYSLGQETMEQDYFIDAKYFFGESVQGQPGPNLIAQQKLDQIINGTRKRMTEEWLKKEGLFDLIDEETKAALAEYDKQVKDLEKYKSKINEIARKLEKDKTTDRKLAPEVKKQLQSQLRTIRAIYERARNSIEVSSRGLVINDSFSGDPLRNNDGFIDFDPLADIKVVGMSLLQQHRKDSNDVTLIKTISNLIQKLKEYKTTDPLLIEKRQKLLNFFGDDPTKFTNRLNNIGTYAQLQKEFNRQSSRHGKVMILKNFENSVLCVPSTRSEDAGGVSLYDGGVLAAFNSANNANLSKDRSEGVDSKGNRIIVIVSSSPIGSLPFTAKIEMNVAPVDQAEAEIIVRNLLEPYARRARNVVEMNLCSEIDEKYKDNPDVISKNRDLGNVRSTLARMTEELGKVSFDVHDQMEQMIVGMGQKAAIYTIGNAITSGIQMEKNKEDVLVGLKLNSKSIITNLKNMVNKSATEGALGLKIEEPDIEFDEYAYKKISTWAQRVKSVEDNARELAIYKESIKHAYQLLAGINSDLLSSKLSQQSKEELLVLRKEWQDKIEKYRMGKLSAMRSMPHFFILYGDPGVGKSQWAHALASLLGFMIRNVDLGGQKSKWVGETAKNTQKVLDGMLKCRDAIFLIDEIDKQIGMGASAGSTGSDISGSHEVTKDQVKRFLDFFELTENQRLFIDNNIFVVLTTNFVEDINTALMSRSRNVFEVPLPDRPEDFKKFLESFLDAEKKKFPDHPLFCDDGKDVNTEDCWETTFKIFGQIDINKLSEKLAGKRIDFRQIKKMIQEALDGHKFWLNSMKRISRGELERPEGLPFTTNNLLEVVDYTKSAKASNAEGSVGVWEVVMKRQEQLDQLLKDRKLKTEIFKNLSGEEKTRVILDNDILKIMNGTSAEGKVAPSPQFDVEEEEYEDPTTGEPRKRITLKETPIEQQVEEVKEKGFEEQPIIEQDKEKKDLKEKEPQLEKDKIEKDKITSSTDYLFKYLQNQGIVSEDGKIINKISKRKVTKTKDVVNKNIINPNSDRFTEGVYLFENGVLIAPATADTPSQIIKTEIEKVRKGK